MLLDKYVRELSKLDNLVVSIDVNNKIMIRFDNLVVKDGPVLKYIAGRGAYLYEAVTNFVEQINGQLLVNEKNREIQYKILIITKEEK